MIFMSSFINFLKRNKLYSAVNLLGLSLSMAFVLLLAVYVTSQLSTDSFQKNADRIYVIAQKETLSSAYWLSRHMKANFPEIERSASYSSNGMQEYKIDGNIVNARTSYADSSFFDMFSFPLVEGDFSEWKASISGVLISESFAKAQFGDRDPVGREIRFDGADSTVSNLTVSGVFKDIENSIIRPCDIFLRGEIMTITNLANDERMSNAGSSTCFVMAYPNADLPARHDDILKWCRENFWRYMSDYGGGDNDVRIIPLRDVYFLSDGNEDYNDSLRLGNKTTVMLLAGMCFLLLLFAILNYVNMTTALSGFRAKEMATRRLIGATKGGIFMKMIVESTIICAAAMVIAVLLGEAISPAASKVLNYDISIFKAISPVSVLVCVLFTVLVGVIAGIVPALIIQKAEPIEIVRGTLRLKTKTLYSKVIIVIQNVITVVMLVTAFTMFLPDPLYDQCSGGFTILRIRSPSAMNMAARANWLLSSTNLRRKAALRLSVSAMATRCSTLTTGLCPQKVEERLRSSWLRATVPISISSASGRNRTITHLTAIGLMNMPTESSK